MTPGRQYVSHRKMYSPNKGFKKLKKSMHELAFFFQGAFVIWLRERGAIQFSP